MNGSGGRVALVAALLILAHLILHVALGIGRAAPDLFAVAVLLASRHTGARGGALLGLVLGLLEDAFSVLSFGAGAVSLAAIGLLGGSTRDLFVGDSRVFRTTYLWLGVWLKSVIFWLTSSALARPAFERAWFVEAPLDALYATVIGLLAFALAGIGGSTDR